MLVKCEKDCPSPTGLITKGWEGSVDDAWAQERIKDGYFSEVREDSLNDLVVKAATGVLDDHVKKLVDAQRAVLDEFDKRFKNFTPAVQLATKADTGIGYDGPENMAGMGLEHRLSYLKTKSFNYQAVYQPTLDNKFLGLGDFARRCKHARGNGVVSEDLIKDLSEHNEFVVKAWTDIPAIKDAKIAQMRWGDQGLLKLLTKADPTGMGEQSGAEGGFLVPPEYSTTIFERVYASFLLQLIDLYPIGSATMTFNASAETSRVRGSRKGGIRAYWVDEAGTITASFPRFRQITLRPYKLAALIPTTSELEQDAFVSLPQLLARNAAEEIQVTLCDAIVRGTGAGQPFGILNAPNRVSVAKETGQAAATVVAENVDKMYTRRFGQDTRNYIWLHHQDIEPQLQSMAYAVGTGGQLLYQPPGGMAAAPYATLKGLPLVPCEHCSTLGTVGDLLLVDLTKYLGCTRGGLQTAMSPHLYFTTDQNAYRFIFRFDGQPWEHSATTPMNGSNTMSAFIELNTRS